MMEDSEHHRAQWQLLPPSLLATVFSELSEVDRYNAGATCRYWQDVDLLPMFWRLHHFKMGWKNKKKAVSACAREVFYMKTFGCHLRDMKLWIDICLPRVKEIEQTIYKGVDDLLHSAPPAMKLKTLVCNNFWFLWSNKPQARKRLLSALCKLLNRQSKYLTEIELQYHGLQLKAGCQVLQALAIPASPSSPASSATDPPSNLSVMKLNGFLRCRNNPGAYPEFAKVMGMFGALRILELEFRYLNDSVLKNLCTGSPLLKTLFLRMDADIVDCTFVSAAGWRVAIQHCPDLQVLVKAIVIMNMELQLESVLLPSIPLVSLDVLLACEHIQMADLLTYLSQHFASCLKLLHLDIADDSQPWNWPRELVDLVSRCTSLTCLSISFVIVPLECLMEMAAARLRSASLSPIQEQLQIHLHSYFNNVLGYRDLQRLSNIRDTFYIQICHHDVCYPHPHKAVMVHESRS